MPKKPVPWSTYIGLTVVVLITIVCSLPGIGIGVDLWGFFANLGNASENAKLMLKPDWAYWSQPIPALIETIEMAVIATVLGALVSLPLSFLGSRVTTPVGWVVDIFRALLSVLRSIPDLLFAAIFVAMVGIGALPGIMALFLFTIGIIVKLTSEVIDACDRGPLEAALSTGGTWPQADRVAVLPQILPSFIGTSLYVFEINLRASAVLGLVGAGGLGEVINLNRKFYYYDRVSVIVLEILVMVVLLEWVSSAIRKRLS